jgi:hypothetical protein
LELIAGARYLEATEPPSPEQKEAPMVEAAAQKNVVLTRKSNGPGDDLAG